MKTKIKIDDFLILMDVVYLDFINDETIKFLQTNSNPALSLQTFVPSPSKFKYINLKEQAHSYNITKTPLDITIHPIDNFMVDVYKSMCRLELMIKDINEKMNDDFFNDESELNDNFSFPIELKKTLKMESKFIRKIFNDIILNCDFTYPEISGIQKNYLIDMLTKSVQNEDYELSAKIRDRIKNITKKYE